MPDITVMLDRPRTLKYGINALCSLEREFGKSIQEMFPQPDPNDPNVELDDDGNPVYKMEFHKLIGLLWAGIRHEDRKLTPEDVEILVDKAIDAGGNIQTLFGQISKAFHESTFLKGAMEEAERKKKKGSKGKTA